MGNSQISSKNEKIKEKNSLNLASSNKKLETKSKTKNFQLQLLTKNNSTFCLTENNLCYVWGWNHYGQLGLGDTKDRFIPTLLSLPNNERISFITGGSYHTICFTENNLCYVWGENEYDQLGLDDKTNRSSPTLLSFPNNEKISFITCGYAHTICLTANNLCYGWGYSYYGELGLGESNKILTPKLLELPNNEIISFVACGTFHTIRLTQNGQCYVSGINSDGQLGLGERNTGVVPTLLKFPNNERISFITCGYSHSMCLTEDNLCYVWGRNGNGQLGLGDTTNRYTPTLLTTLKNEKIFTLCSNNNYTICLTEKNLCYVWGENRYGQLGLGHKNDCSSPTLLSLPNNEKISFITCGYYHTICLSENNLCYVWGRNATSELSNINSILLN